MHRNQHIADLGPVFSGLGIRQVIICPGSRNAPLIQLFTSDHRFTCHSIVDERSAAFIALGMARQRGEPVAVVTTSGTAVMNLAPAVAEAFFQSIPLVLITGDRPRERITQFDNQVIRQKEALLSHLRAFYELPADVTDSSALEKMLSTVEEVIRRGMEFPGGPVHFNVPLPEPLYEPLPPPMRSSSFEEPLPEPLDDPPSSQNEEHIEHEFTDLLAEYLEQDRRVLIMAGMGRPDPQLETLLMDLTGCGRVAVVAENIANLSPDRFISNPELVLSGAGAEERESLLPELVVSFGGQVVSKRLRLFLEDPSHPEKILFHEIIREPAMILDPLLQQRRKKVPSITRQGEDPSHSGPNPYLELWKRIEIREVESAERFLAAAPHCNLTAVRAVLSALPEGAVLHLGNSAAIRYAQLMPPEPGVSCFANRGTSGIDGCVSTAVGAAMVSGRMHVLVVGDLSFVYDSNALWNKNFPDNLKIIVLNDGGGGVFRLLDGPSKMAFFEEYSVTHHPVSLELLAGAFGRRFLRAADRDELEEKLGVLFRPGSGYSILEADTTGSNNSQIFKEFFRRNS